MSYFPIYKFAKPWRPRVICKCQRIGLNDPAEFSNNDLFNILWRNRGQKTDCDESLCFVSKPLGCS